MKLTCPHGKEIVQVTKFGVLSYEHKNGSSCDIMSNFKVRVRDIDRVCAKYANKDLSNGLMTFVTCTSKYTLKKIIYKLATIDDCEELAVEIKQLVKLGYMDYIGASLARVFGIVFIRNLETINENGYANELGRYASYRRKRSVSMIHITDERMRKQKGMLSSRSVQNKKSLREAVLSLNSDYASDQKHKMAQRIQNSVESLIEQQRL